MKLFSPNLKQKEENKKILKFLIGTVAVIILCVMYINHEDKNQSIINEPVIDRVAASKDLEGYLTAIGTLGLITSYEFNAEKEVIYVTLPWYATEASVKKDIMEKISNLKYQARGTSNYEVRDKFSDKKVGNVSWTGSVSLSE